MGFESSREGLARSVGPVGDTSALKDFLDEAQEGAVLVSSLLLETELRRLANRASVRQSKVTELLERFDLLVPDRALFRDAGLLAGHQLRSLDALHVAASLRMNADFVITYDENQAGAAMSAGLRVLSVCDFPPTESSVG